MNIKPFLYFLILLGFLFINSANAQNTYQLGVLPSLNFNHKLKKSWSLNFKIESRQLLRQGEFNGPANKNDDYVLTDFTLITAKKVGLNTRIASGYLIRLNGDEATQRFIQQFTIIQNTPSLRFSHRFVSDQTFLLNESTEYRLRYRLTTEIPLNGQSVDPKELYIKINNEYLNSFQNSDYDLEIRVVPLLGYSLIGNNNIEIGLDYRVNNFLNNFTRHSFWINLSWFIVI